MTLLSIARVPPIVVSPDSTVLQAIDLTLGPKVGAVVVVENDRMIGIFTERDVMLKVVHSRKDPETTRVGDVMTSPVQTVPSDLSPDQVLRRMLKAHIRHFPVSDDGRVALGMLSLRDLLFAMVEDLTYDLENLESFIGADSPGG